MARKRSRLEIVYEILKVLTQGESSPTRIAMLVNMPYDRFMEVVNTLKEKRLVQEVEIDDEDKKRKALQITDKGIELLKELEKILNLLRDYGIL